MYGHLEPLLEEIRLGIDGVQDIDENGQPKPAGPMTSDEPAAGRRPARAKATRPSMAEAEPATGSRS